MADYKDLLLELHENLHILQEREAGYAGNAPLDLLNQISHHQKAIAFTERVIADELSEPDWREALRPLLVSLPDEARAIIDQRGQTVQGDQYNVVGELHLHLDAVPNLPEAWRQEILAARSSAFPDVDKSKRPKIYLSCHGADLAAEQAALSQALVPFFRVEVGDAALPEAEMGKRVFNSDVLVLVQATAWSAARAVEYEAARRAGGRVAVLYFQKKGDFALDALTELFIYRVQGDRYPWQNFTAPDQLNVLVLNALLDRMSAWAGTGRLVPLAVLVGVYVAVQGLARQEANPLAWLKRLAADLIPKTAQPIRAAVIEAPPPAPQRLATDFISKTAPPARTAVIEAPPPTPQRRTKRYPEKPYMVLIPAGKFWMGSDQQELERVGVNWYDWMEKEKPYHQVYLPDYAIGRYPITNAEYASFMQDNSYRQRGLWTTAGWQWKGERTQPYYWTDKKWNQPDHPVVGISWYEAVAYCRWLEKITGRPYRLPTEAEREKAARGDDGRVYPWGNKWDKTRCNNVELNLGQTMPVGNFPQGDSPYSVADMVGNVWEWCATKWEKKYPYNVQENEWLDNYLEGTEVGTEVRVLRGGSWGRSQFYSYCAFRIGYAAYYEEKDFGFRIVVSSISP